MAIEDAATLADVIADFPADPLAALAAWERARRPRVIKSRAARRGQPPSLACPGPVAFARNLFLTMRPPEKLAADLDWLYGWEADTGEIG